MNRSKILDFEFSYSNEDGSRLLLPTTLIEIKDYNPYLSLYKVTQTLDELIKRFLGYNKIFAGNTKLLEDTKQYIYLNTFVEMNPKHLTRKVLLEYFRHNGSLETLREFIIFVGIVEKVLATEKEKHIQSQVEYLKIQRVEIQEKEQANLISRYKLFASKQPDESLFDPTPGRKKAGFFLKKQAKEATNSTGTGKAKIQTKQLEGLKDLTANSA